MEMGKMLGLGQVEEVQPRRKWFGVF